MNNDKNDEQMITEEYLRQLLDGFKGDMEGGAYIPEIFMIQFESGEKIWTDMEDAPEGSEARFQFVRRLGFDLRLEYGSIREAIYVGGAWLTSAKDPLSNIIPPRLHPGRWKALSIVGRNRDKSRSAVLLQHYHNSEDGKPIWHKLDFRISEDKRDAIFEGILDELFAGVIIDKLT